MQPTRSDKEGDTPPAPPPPPPLPSPSPPSLRNRQQQHYQTIDPPPSSAPEPGQPQDGEDSEVVHTQPDWSDMDVLTSEFEFRGNNTGFSEDHNAPSSNSDPVQSHHSINYPGIDSVHSHTSNFDQGMNPIPTNQPRMGSNINNDGYTTGPSSFFNPHNQPLSYTQNNPFQPGNSGNPVTGSMNDWSNRNDGRRGYSQQHLQAQAPGHANFSLLQQPLPHFTAAPNQDFLRTDTVNSRQGNSTRTQLNDLREQASGPETGTFQSLTTSLPHENIFAVPQNPNRVAPAFAQNALLFNNTRRKLKNPNPRKKTRRPRAKLTSDPFASERGYEGSEKAGPGDGEGKAQEHVETESGAGGENENGTVVHTLPTDEDIEAMNAVTDEDLRLAKEAMSGYGWT